MSYRYPHQDDSDENGFGESLQGASQTSSSTNTGRLLGRRTAAAVDRENDDFQPAVETQRDDDDDDGDPDEEDEDVVFHDAEQMLYAEEEEDGDEEVEDDDDDEDYEDDEDGEEEEEEDDDDDEGQHDQGQRVGFEIGTITRILDRLGGGISHHQFMALLHSQDLPGVLFHDEQDAAHFWGRRRRRNVDPDRFPKVPSEKGRELMSSGSFGSTDRSSFSLSSYPSSVKTKKSIARRVLDRELGIDNRSINQNAMAQQMIPSSNADLLIHYQAPVYCGQFSEDGNFFYACVKDFRVRMYDTSNPYNWRYYKTASYNWGQWTLTDAHLSPDNRWLAYTSLQSHVAFAPTDPNDKGDPYQLDLGAAADGRERTNMWGWGGRGNFAIWSIRFSGDGRELIAGNNASSIIVYDIESRRVLHNIEGHEDDVNAVCFADPKDPHVLYSGSDDQVIKVWDRRSMGDGREAGAFVGHCEGLTYLDSKGDGRYLLSNSKDQTMKLWDLRMAMSTQRYEELQPRQHTMHTDYDYRMDEYNMDDWFPHPNDNSVVTFRGHKVQGTLIRCHFSPAGATDSRYVYSGSHDGKIYVWNMDATLAATIDVGQSTHWRGKIPGGGRQWRRGREDQWNCCVREPYWHPNAPIIAASSWGGYNMSFGSVSVHSWNENLEDDGDPPMGHRVNDHLAADWLADD